MNAFWICIFAVYFIFDERTSECRLKVTGFFFGCLCTIILAWIYLAMCSVYSFSSQCLLNFCRFFFPFSAIVFVSTNHSLFVLSSDFSPALWRKIFIHYNVFSSTFWCNHLWKRTINHHQFNDRRNKMCKEKLHALLL